ncbi:MAG: sugar nucleotide-binding protein [Chloroflexi bacterium]|nr:sugar nucleotide-binding protein [Chloroflexota bacterium]
MKLYVTGGTGLVGSNVIRLARQRGYEAVASQFGPQPEWEVDYTLDPLDLSDHEAIRRSILRHEPDAVIHAAAILDHRLMYDRREWCWSMMVDGSRVLGEACREAGARLVFISSDWVFDGRAGVVDETSPPNPVNFYGVMKVVAERDLLGMDGLDVAVARLAGIYGLNYAAQSLQRKDNGLGFDFSVYVTYRLAAGLPAAVWTGPKVNDEANPTLASDCADMLLRLAAHDERGIFHCFGSEWIGRMELAYKIADAFDADRSLIYPTLTPEAVLEEALHIGIPYRTRAKTDITAATLGRRAFNVDEGLAAFRKEWDAFWG